MKQMGSGLKMGGEGGWEHTERKTASCYHSQRWLWGAMTKPPPVTVTGFIFTSYLLKTVAGHSQFLIKEHLLTFYFLRQSLAMQPKLALNSH